MGAIATFSPGIARISGLAGVLGEEELVLRPSLGQVASLRGVVGWGRKAKTREARSFSATHGLDYTSLEDGFVRSVGFGTRGVPTLSIVLDRRGIYYDATGPSDLEAILNASSESTLGQHLASSLDRASQCMDRICAAHISKYNNAPLWPAVALAERSQRRSRVLVVDQTAGDMSLVHGQLAVGGILAMLRAAYVENPDAEVWIKAHPEVVAGIKRGHLDPSTTVLEADWSARTRWVVDACNPLALIDQVDRVYVATSQMGFDALMMGKPVVCFGMPFYAGWGLTDDRVSCSRRTVRRTETEVFAAAYLLYSRYFSPHDRSPGQLEDVLDHIELQVANHRKNEGTILCFGFSRWKRAWVRTFLASPGNDVKFVRRATSILSTKNSAHRGLPQPIRVLVWGQTGPVGLVSTAKAHDIGVSRMEDGFLRSVGLGSDLTAPSSLVVDLRGIYYDPRGESDLEAILANHDFTDDLCARAKALAASIVGARVSKYNLGASTREAVERDEIEMFRRSDRKLILVPGQVEEDASIRLGCEDICTNLQLLEAVRRACPEACVLYKPHPDVEARNRRHGTRNTELRAQCDHWIEALSLPSCLDLVDEVHTMTSLVGFEALLRGLDVTCYGKPFYAGWGLTDDAWGASRRGRNLTLEELVAGSLICYPRYVDHRTGFFSTAERTVAALRAGLDRGDPSFPSQLWVSRHLQKLRQLAKGLYDAG